MAADYAFHAGIRDSKHMELAWWHWLVLGLGLGLLELLVPSFFIIWFGLGALLVGLAMMVLPELSFTTQVALWTVASVAMTVLWFKVLRGDADKTRSGRADEALGEIGVLVRAVFVDKPAMDSVACGRKLRLAWATGVAS